MSTNPLTAAYNAATSPKAHPLDEKGMRPAAPAAVIVSNPTQTAAPHAAPFTLEALRAKLAQSTARVNPPEASISDRALEPESIPSPVAVAPIAPPQVAVSDTPSTAKRTRRTKAQIEADRAAEVQHHAADDLAVAALKNDAATPVTSGVEPSVEAYVPSLAYYSTNALLAEVYKRVSGRLS
jgi:hypothetical protein